MCAINSVQKRPQLTQEKTSNFKRFYLNRFHGQNNLYSRKEFSFFQVSLVEEILKIYILIRSNKMQQYAGIYLLQNHSTYFGCPSHPSSGIHKTVTAASGTATTFRQRGHMAKLAEGCCCTRGCSYSFMYS